MSILKRVPNSKLWLLKFEASAVPRLKKEATKLGIDKSRIVIHDTFDQSIEFLVKSKAHLFLDTPIFNAHTTSTDVLWAGVPILTLAGDTFAQRVAASMLKQADLEFMIARTIEEYEEMAVALGSRPAKLAAIKASIEAKRFDVKAFDTEGFVHEFERSLKISWEVWAANYGEQMHIITSSNPPRSNQDRQAPEEDWDE
mmetsp:Transcript_6776/g.16666  ORF Transcript_6776/g.16666 Transcript_6776/m.16666 type:complete len:199 (-) Transcript_6776:24-620(-)